MYRVGIVYTDFMPWEEGHLHHFEFFVTLGIFPFLSWQIHGTD